MVGALIIKRRLGLSDTETIKQRRENPCLQYFCGLQRYQHAAFAPPLFVNLRERLRPERVAAFNQAIINRASESRGRSDIRRPRRQLMITTTTCRRAAAPRRRRPREHRLAPVAALSNVVRVGALAAGAVVGVPLPRDRTALPARGHGPVDGRCRRRLRMDLPQAGQIGGGESGRPAAFGAVAAILAVEIEQRHVGASG